MNLINSRKYKRIVVKISGEYLGENDNNIINIKKVENIVAGLKKASLSGLQIALIIGGGNILRGIDHNYGIKRVTADYMGMIGTIFNSLALRDILEKNGLPTKLYSCINIDNICPKYEYINVMDDFNKGKIIIFAGGTGHPYFSTDTAASIKAAEINADIVFKATNVNGVYDKNPTKNKFAKMYDSINYMDVIKNKLEVIDLTSVLICMNNKIPIHIFNINKIFMLDKIAMSLSIGTLIK